MLRIFNPYKMAHVFLNFNLTFYYYYYYYNGSYLGACGLVIASSTVD